ncbi:MAG: carbonic anhydrase [Verrucomicrobiales bacterium]|nr:carbonic anhydrase [Verrucomicrobiales bacterium]
MIGLNSLVQESIGYQGDALRWPFHPDLIALRFAHYLVAGREDRWLGLCMSNLRDLLDTFLRRTPQLGKGVYIAKGAVVVGDVMIGDYSSVWYNAVLRGDINRIELGHHTNIQDSAVVHLAEEFPCIIGNYVTVGHSAVVHACTIGDETLVGMGAIILDGAVVGRQCIIGANALVTQGAEIPEGSLVLGSPGRVVRTLTHEQRSSLKSWADKYVVNGEYCLEFEINVGGPAICESN